MTVDEMRAELVRLREEFSRLVDPSFDGQLMIAQLELTVELCERLDQLQAQLPHAK